MIISRTPLRISFAGGGTDLRSFYEVEPGVVLGATINKYVYIAVNRPLDEKIKVSYSKTEVVDSVDRVEHAIVRETLRYTKMTANVEVVSISDVPPGTGLGSSGSFTVGLLHALYAHQSVFVPKEQLARDACAIEIDLLGAPIGKQDQYMASYGGLQYLHFNPDESVFIEPVICSNRVKYDLSDNLMLFYTGRPRDAASILAKQFEKTREIVQFNMLKNIKQIAIDMMGILTSGKDLREFGGLLHEEWLYKRGLVEGIATEEIDGYYAKARSAGAIGGKITGAGGGGFILLYCEKDKQPRVREALFGLKEINFGFDSQGTSIITVS
jgi:D-glycero-alpha-D-manno-heptose-7-phosphate kinase